MGVSMGGQDMLRLMFLAPDFTGSQFLFLKSGFEPGGSIVWQSMATMVALNAMMAQVINHFYSGQTHWEHPFSVVSDDGRHIYTVRTMPSDLWHAVTDPRGFTANRLNPVTLRPLMEFFTGRNQAGRTVSMGEQISDLIKNVTPIPLQPLAFARPLDDTGWGQYLKFAGLQTFPNRTLAESTAIQKASGHDENGSISNVDLKQHQFVNNRLRQLRAGEITWRDIGEDVGRGLMTVAQFKRIETQMKQPTELASRISALPLSDALDVYEVATEEEKRVLFPLLREKYFRFMKTEAKLKTADQINFMRYKVLKILQPPSED
jgi:hypothetical protein